MAFGMPKTLPSSRVICLMTFSVLNGIETKRGGKMEDRKDGSSEPLSCLNGIETKRDGKIEDRKDGSSEGWKFGTTFPFE